MLNGWTNIFEKEKLWNGWKNVDKVSKGLQYISKNNIKMLKT